MRVGFTIDSRQRSFFLTSEPFWCSGMVLASKETLRNRTWDREYDLYIHLQKKNRVLQSENEKLKYFNTLLQEFLVKVPKADSELVQFTDGSSSIVQSQVLHLQDQNREDTEENEDDDNVVIDPKYKYFLDHLRPHGQSYVLEIVEDGVFVKYEDESSLVPNVSLDTDHVHMHACANYKGKLRVRKSKGAKLSAIKSPNVNSNCVASESRKCSRGKKLKGAKLSAVKNRGVKCRDVASKEHKRAGNCKGGRKRKRLKMHTVPVNVEGKGVSAVKAACFEQTEGQNIGHRKKGRQIDTPSGMEIRVKEEIEYDDDDAHDIRRPMESPVLKVGHFWYDNEANARKLTVFREKLMKELRRPYCEEEHKRLLQDFTVRKPVQHHRDLRGVMKIYEEDYLGKSFLDHNLDLAEEIDSARDDHPKVLNLLRGFFFWLGNLTHEGSFMPWRVPSCLDVLPQQ